jgi:chitin binding protein/carbohydrate binding protein with CBM5/12 domain
MRRTFTVPLASAAAAIASLALMAPAQAHGYISSPPSRQALCAAGTVKDCGQIQFEPQSVEAPKGSKLCSGGNSLFRVLDDNSRNWPAGKVGKSVTFNWALTARHATSTWQYFIGDKQLAEFNDGGKQPNATVSHAVNFGGITGRQTVLAVWNIADTPMAFYACIDVQIGAGGGGSTPVAPPAAPPAAAPPAAAPPAAAPPAAAPPAAAPPAAAPPAAAPPAAAPVAPPATGDQPGGRPVGDAKAWQSWTAYTRGDRVTFDGKLYECRQSHTTLPGWEPPIVLALWLPI